MEEEAFPRGVSRSPGCISGSTMCRERGAGSVLSALLPPRQPGLSSRSQEMKGQEGLETRVGVAVGAQASSGPGNSFLLSVSTGHPSMSCRP